MSTRDYLLTYLNLKENNKDKLQVSMDTEEFGKMYSKRIDAVKDKKINQKLMDSLADELIDKYEKQLEERPKQFNFNVDILPS